MNKIINDLIELREAVTESQREFARLSGLNFGKIQRIESRKNVTSIPIEDMDSWLRACKSSLGQYFHQSMAISEIKAANEDKELVDLFRRALLNPAKRKQLKALLEMILPDADE